MSPEEPFTASKAEVQQLIQHLVSLQDKWPSEHTLANLSPRMVNGLLAHNDSVEHGRPGLRIVFILIVSLLLRFVRPAAVYPAHHRIQELMAQLIPVMEARLQQQQLPQTLLRASNVSSALPDTLLRAACLSAPEPPQQLLRAAISEHPDTDI